MQLKIPALNISLIRYFFVGGMAFIVDFTLFALLVKSIGVPWFLAAIFSFIAATLVNYILSIKHVFQSGVRFRRSYEIFLVFLVSVIGLGINQLVIWLVITLMEWDVLFAKVIATGVVFFWNYMIRYTFVFKRSFSV